MTIPGLIFCILTAVLLHLSSIFRVTRNSENIKRVSSEYASQLFRTNVLLILSLGAVRVTSLIFITPPEELNGLIQPIRKIEIVAALLFFPSFLILLAALFTAG